MTEISLDHCDDLYKMVGFGKSFRMRRILIFFAFSVSVFAVMGESKCYTQAAKRILCILAGSNTVKEDTNCEVDAERKLHRRILCLCH